MLNKENTNLAIPKKTNSNINKSILDIVKNQERNQHSETFDYITVIKTICKLKHNIILHFSSVIFLED